MEIFAYPILWLQNDLSTQFLTGSVAPVKHLKSNRLLFHATKPYKCQFVKEYLEKCITPILKKHIELPHLI